MNLHKINEWLSLVANLGVIAGILFLAVEIQQNTEMMQSQTRDSMTEKQIDWYMAIGASEFASELFFDQSITGPIGEIEAEGITPRTQALNFMIMSNIRMWDSPLFRDPTNSITLKGF